MFANECLTTLVYESTATSIAMAGVFLCFLIEYLGSRLIAKRHKKTTLDVENEQQSSDSLKASTPTKEITDAPNTTLAALGHNHGANIGPDNHFNVAVMESGIVFHSIRRSFCSNRLTLADHTSSNRYHPQCHSRFLLHNLLHCHSLPPNVRRPSPGHAYSSFATTNSNIDQVLDGQFVCPYNTHRYVHRCWCIA